ncbi:MAG: gamma-glutamyl-gamma-aminobutyrate hydrolase family protein [Rhodospirillales bacterium]|nr:gamma-glutamyl-gamma-aminobutyrate hydrolase family protein [Rhodospirillales bacterium]
MKPLIGISCCVKLFGTFGMPNHAASDTYVRATDFVVGGIPVLIPANGERSDSAGIAARLDGLILTGSRSNVEPARYGGKPHPEGVPEDHERDGATLPLIRAAVAAGLPILAICRGLQELNVALGGSLHQRLQDLPDRMDHATPMAGNGRLRTGKAHTVSVTPGGWLHRLAQSSSILVNSLHNQGIDRLADGLLAEATAPDGTIEAVRGTSSGFVVGVQWHPEYDWDRDELSRRIFESFGAAVAARARGLAAAAD